MNELLRIAVTVALAGAAERGRYDTRKLIASIVASVLAAWFGLGVIGCLTAALWIYCIPLVGPAVAPAVAAVFLLILGGIICFAVWQNTRPKTVRPASIDPQVAIEQASQIVAKIFREHKGSALAAAAIAGLIASSSTNPRR